MTNEEFSKLKITFVMKMETSSACVNNKLVCTREARVVANGVTNTPFQNIMRSQVCSVIVGDYGSETWGTIFGMIWNNFVDLLERKPRTFTTIYSWVNKEKTYTAQFKLD